ncbi:MAG: sensor histidine kinase [Halarcobacter sp.]
MALNKLAISYKCLNSIGNSLNLRQMSSEFLKTFVFETDAVHGSYYINENNRYEQFISIGNNICLVLSDLIVDETAELIIDDFNSTFKVFIFKVENGYMVFIYSLEVNIDFLKKIFEALKNRLNISINSCLNVQELKKTNEDLSEQKLQLENLTMYLKDEIDAAIKINMQKERKLFEQSKMLQMSELISNIAHQWRQPLSVITTSASGMKIKKDLDMLSTEDFLHYVQSILDNSKYLSNTLDEFSEYIKEGQKQKEVILQERLKLALSLIESSYNVEKIKVVEGFIEKKDITINIVVGDLLRVLVSMFNNSKDAFIIKEIEDRWVKYEIYKKDEKTALITLEDNAGGIPESIIDKIFNPYFTTKHQYKGTGIGLYSAYDVIVNKLKGKLKVENTKGGAKFYIEIPIYK